MARNNFLLRMKRQMSYSNLMRTMKNYRSDSSRYKRGMRAAPRRRRNYMSTVTRKKRFYKRKRYVKKQKCKDGNC